MLHVNASEPGPESSRCVDGGCVAELARGISGWFGFVVILAIRHKIEEGLLKRALSNRYIYIYICMYIYLMYTPSIEIYI